VQEHQPTRGIVSANLVQEHQPTRGIVSANLVQEHQPTRGIVSANLVQEHQPTWGIVSAAQERRPPRGIDTPARLGLVVAWLCNWWWRVVCGWLRLRVKFA